MLAVRLDPEIKERLERLADRTGQTKSFHVQEALRQHLEDLEDAHLATERLRTLGKTYSAEEVKRELGL